jgi:hypothetical protein
MSLVNKLKERLAASTVEPLPEVGPAMLARIGEQVAGGTTKTWCKAAWGSGSCAAPQEKIVRGL